ncbi:MogA/MoaB family molybdenum cofactor biosynthesis protein [Acetohalobium arabaticum]|uniref:Molybdenum cofactor biosynthesis protein B n=1 Tax=Acetohalobium arabaticum (strain ATCC 49924 / DSM 5501 / Z-7288) TaxID=574087 RepID=D9QT60_ACEAZ|nr:MogA/MoaB family molybdenum cofactor biosynthesis protein [Acetohalobium arabaticum]ADL13560.1 molybdopterin adenylyltransferase [Acetohalobium arabaticum DSM 5501]
MIKVGIITASDKGSRGEREDKSGQVIEEVIAEIEGEVVSYQVVPDEKEVLKAKMLKMVTEDGVDLLLTTGGTGLAPRDVTPDATLELIEREVPGIAEAMRMESLQVTDRAMLSRARAGVIKETLIVNLPGSPKAVQECLEVVIPALPHAVELIKDEVEDCAR